MKKLLFAMGSVLMRKDPLSEIVERMGNQTLPGRCATCGESFKYPMNVVFLPWEPRAGTIDVGGWCKRCGHAVCERHVGTMPMTVSDQKGWVLSCTACGYVLTGVKDALTEGG